MEEGTFVGWLKKDGEAVRPGEPLFGLETEKAAEEGEALDAGTLRLGAGGPAAGGKVKVGDVLAYLVAEGEALPTQARCASEGKSETTAKPQAASSSAGGPSGLKTRRRPAVSPRARRVAKE